MSTVSSNVDRIIKIYLYGCNCGLNGTYIRQIKSYARQNNIEVQIKYTKYDKDHRQEHVTYLAAANLRIDNYQPIVVEDDSITPLRLWKSF